MIYSENGKYFSECDECHKTREISLKYYKIREKEQKINSLCPSCRQLGSRNHAFKKEPWNKGLTKKTSKSVEAYAESSKETKKNNGYKPSWNSGKTMAELKGEEWATEFKRKVSKSKTGVPNLKKRGITSEYAKSFNNIKKLIRMRLWNSWGQKIRQRDNYCCVICGAKHVYLEVHHIKPFRTFIREVAKELSLDLSRWDSFTPDTIELLCQKIVELHKLEHGITVCAPCHKSIDPFRKNYKEE